jgi:nitroreductase
MEFDQVVHERRSIRAYRPDPVPEDVVEKILGTAIHSPSAGNLQAWEFVVVREAERKRRLARAAVEQHFVSQAPVVIVVCRNLERNVFRYGQRGRDFYSYVDASVASMLILLAATDEGLGGCFVGAFVDDDVASALDLPDHVRPLGIIPLGQPDQSPPRRDRLALSKVVHHESFGA